MKLSVFPEALGYAADIAQVASLFFGRADLTGPGEESELRADCSQREEGGRRVCRVALSGRWTAVGEDGAQPLEDPRLDGQLRRRQYKFAAYRALRLATGQHPPWGALTGIRPTRLVWPMLEAGQDLRQALDAARRRYDLSPEKTALLARVLMAQRGLPAAGENDVDIYVGIPFCTSRCRYCSFISACVGGGERLEAYAEALKTEIGGALRLLEHRGLRPRAFYMGGGTPTALPARLLGQVLAACRPLTEAAREVTVEAGRPDSLDGEKLRVLLDAGTHRISINPQTMHDETLRRIGRDHTRARTEEAFALARRLGFLNINMDLIAGLPGEDGEMFQKTLAWAESLRPEHLTVHTLCLKRSSSMELLGDGLPDPGPVAAMVAAAGKAARGMGLRPYYLYRQKRMAGALENTGYALPGYECLYNVDSMEDTVSILALGAGGISKRVFPRRQRILRMPNVKDIDHYIKRAGEMARRKEELWEEAASAFEAADVLPEEGEDAAAALVHEP